MNELEQLPSEYYASGLSDRKPYEDRAEKFCELTIPAMFRTTGSSGADKLPDRYVQSLGAKLVKNLSSKITLTLMPPSASGFRFSPDLRALQVLTGGNPDMISQINADLSAGVDLVNKQIEAQDIRKHIFGLIDHQLLVGSCIMEKVPNKGIKTHSLRNIVVTLNDVGDCIQMCVLEELKSLPVELQGTIPEDAKEGDKYKLYTMGILDENTEIWTMYQEIGGQLIGQEKSYKADKFPFSYQGMLWNTGEPYHRPFVEDYYGSLNSYDKLSKVLTQGALIASKSLTFVNERGGRTRKADVANSQNGAVVDGSAEDVTSFQHNKNFDFQVPMQVRAELRQELEEAFLAKNSITRQAERVTAEEIRQMAQELESAMAGVYATISNRITKQIVMWIMNELKLKFKAVNVDIITGLNALGLSNEVAKLDGFMTRLAQMEKTVWVKDKELVDRYANGYGINTVNLIKTPAEVQQEMQAQQQAQQQAVLAQSGAESLGKNAGEALIKGQAQ